MSRRAFFNGLLGKAGAIVKVVRLPAGPISDDGKPAKVGLDDFLVSHGAAELRKLLDRAQPPEAPDPESLVSPAGELDPASEAGRIIAASSIDGVPRIRYWRGSLWWWSSGRYVEKPDDEVRAEILNRLNQNFFGVKRAHAADVLAHVQAKSLVRGEVDVPTWLDEPPPGFIADECLATKKSIVHLPSLVTKREPAIVPSSPKFFTTSACDFDVNLEANRPTKWIEFLAALWGEDKESIQALQEWFGYSLTADTRQQKVLIIVGPKRSGKGTIARVLTGIVGKGNVAAPTLAGLATNFGLWPLIGKSVAIISDARLSGRADQVAVVERLLSISGEDSITVDRKNLQPLTCRLGVRFVILTNELPRLSDASGAIVSRMILLRMTRSFYGEEDHGLTDRLLAEREGILLWSIEGWRRLRERGRFVQPDSGLEALGDMSDLASPVAVFIRDCCEVNPTEAVAVADLFAAWQRWCKHQGREKFAGSVQSFARDLLASEPGLHSRRPREGGSRVRIYEGIGLQEGF